MADSFGINGRKLVILWIVFFLYLLLGGFIFKHLEKDNEETQRVLARTVKREFLNDFTCLDSEDLEDLISALLEVQGQGVDPRGNVSDASKWDFTSSFFFSGTVVTTIGYGQRTPKTEVGQIVCILYALVGIPFTGLLLAVVGDFYHCKFHKIWSNVECCIRTYVSRYMCRSLAFCILLVLCYIVLLILPTFLFMYLETWSFHIAHYYAVITLTTIGFGDYVASSTTVLNDEWKEMLYEVGLVVWYIFGLAYLSILITAIGKKEKQMATKLGSKMGSKMGSKIVVKSKNNDNQLEKLPRNERATCSDKGSCSFEPDCEDKDIFTMSGQRSNIVL